MILSNGVQNAYEDVPEHLKDLIKNVRSQKGGRPKSTPSREALVQKHKEHLKLLGEGKVPVRNVILPLPYPPSRMTVKDSSHSNKVRLHPSSDMSARCSRGR